MDVPAILPPQALDAVIQAHPTEGGSGRAQVKNARHCPFFQPRMGMLLLCYGLCPGSFLELGGEGQTEPMGMAK